MQVLHEQKLFSDKPGSDELENVQLHLNRGYIHLLGEFEVAEVR